MVMGEKPNIVVIESVGRSSAMDGRTTRDPAYAIGQRQWKQVEEIFGRLETVAVLRKTQPERLGIRVCCRPGEPIRRS
jgi:hypothetical protein